MRLNLSSSATGRGNDGLNMDQIKSWTVSDNLWCKDEPLIPARMREPVRKYQRKAGAGRKPMSSRQVFSGIVYVLRTGIQWKALPREFGSSSAVHQYFTNWHGAGFLQKLWQAGLAEYDGMHGIAWQWQSADGTVRQSAARCGMCWSEPDRQGEKKDANTACWSTAVGSRCRSPSAAPTSTTPSCWIGRWLR